MLSVTVVRGIAIILILSLTFGCVSNESAKKYANSPEALIDSARVKIDLADNYILEGNLDLAKRVLEDGWDDLDNTGERFNIVLDNAEMEGVLAAAGKIDFALLYLEQSMLVVARANLAAARQELVRVGISLMGAKDRIAPQRFTVINNEFPLTYYGTVDEVYIGYQAAPHNIAAAAREAFYSYHETDSEEDLARGIFLTEYLIFASSERGGGQFVVWENNFEWPVYELSSGWIGALSQAGCVKALMLAYQATDDEKYREFAERALVAFDVPVSEGGLRTARADGSESYVWFPEYARSEPPFVLNGFITTVIWLREYYEKTGNSKAGVLYEDGLKSIVHFLPSYDQVSNWSYYDAIGHNSSSHYHELHVKQMTLLYDFTGDSIFRNYQEKWSGGIE